MSNRRFEKRMWHAEVSVGSLLLALAWLTGVSLVLLSWVDGEDALGQLGVILAGAGGVLVLMRDNQRTRRMLRRPGENIAPMRGRAHGRD